MLLKIKVLRITQTKILPLRKLILNPELVLKVRRLVAKTSNQNLLGIEYLAEN